MSGGRQVSIKVAVLCVVFRIPMASGLKDKRRVLKRLKSDLRQHFNVSVSEVGDQDVFRRGVIAAAMVTGSGDSVDAVFERILEKFYEIPEIEVIESQLDIY